MAKTYTYPCTLYLRGADSYTGTYYVYSDTSTCYIGRKDSTYYRSAFEVESTVPAASKITKAVLRLNVSDHGPSTATYTWRLYQRSGSAGYTDATVSYTTAAVKISEPGTTIDFDATIFLQAGITSLIIISPTQPPYSSSWVGFDSASLIVTTNETDYVLSYNANGGTGAPSQQKSTTTTGSATFTISSTKPTRTGYTFKGWAKTASATSADYQPGGSITISANTTLYAVWQINTYTVTYNKGANGTGANTTDTKTYGKALTLKGAIFTRTGYTQTGWATSDGDSKAYDLFGSYTDNAAATFYPFWTANTYTVTFNPNGGTVSTTTKKVTYAATYGTLPAPTRIGYKFDGWFTSASGGTQVLATTKVSITANQTLYAHWTVQSIAHVTDVAGTQHDGIVYVYDAEGVPHIGINYVFDADGVPHVNG